MIDFIVILRFFNIFECCRNIYLSYRYRNLRFNSFGFARNTIHDFRNTILNSKWHCLRQMPQKQRENAGKHYFLLFP